MKKVDSQAPGPVTSSSHASETTEGVPPKQGADLSIEERAEVYKYVERMWTLGNTIIGFSIAQALAFLYGLNGSDLVGHLDSTLAQTGIDLAIVICGAVASVFLYRCHYHEDVLMGRVYYACETKIASKDVYHGRLVIQILISLATIAIFHVSLKYSPHHHR